MVVGWWCWQRTGNRRRKRAYLIISALVKWWCWNRTNCRQKQAYLLIFGIGWVVVLAKDQPPPKMSVLACFGIGWVVVLEQDQPPSKTSILAHFRQWFSGGAGTAIEKSVFGGVVVPYISQMGGYVGNRCIIIKHFIANTKEMQIYLIHPPTRPCFPSCCSHGCVGSSCVVVMCE